MKQDTFDSIIGVGLCILALGSATMINYTKEIAGLWLFCSFCLFLISLWYLLPNPFPKDYYDNQFNIQDESHTNKNVRKPEGEEKDKTSKRNSTSFDENSSSPHTTPKFDKKYYSNVIIKKLHQQAIEHDKKYGMWVK